MRSSTWVRRHSPTQGSARRVLESIAARVAGGDWGAVGFEEIARDTGVSLSTVKRCVRYLEAHQHIDVDHRRGRGNPNLYRVVTDRSRVGRVRPATGEDSPGDPPGDYALDGTHRWRAPVHEFSVTG